MAEISRSHLVKLMTRSIETEKALAVEMARHEQAMTAIKENQRDLQKTCPHPLTEYIPDASGNNDSYYNCLICNASDKRLK